MPYRLWTVPLLLAVSATGCFRPDYPQGVECSSEGFCPGDQECGSDGFCSSPSDIRDGQPSAQLEISHNPAVSNEELFFDGRSSSHSSEAHNIARYEWDFDYIEGVFDVDSTGSRVVRSYFLPENSGARTFVVALRVTDDNAPPKVDLQTLTVEVVEPTFRVTNLATAGPGSLREAIAVANALPGSTIAFDTTGTINLSSEIVVESGSDIHIYGPGEDSLVIDASNNSRVIRTELDSIVEITSVRIVGGLAPQFEGGGGIRGQGDLVVRRCSIAQNRAEFGGGIASEGNLILSDSTVSGNIAQSGGALSLGGFFATIERSLIHSNTSLNGFSGGVLEAFSDLILENTTLTSNMGGGLTSRFGTVEMSNSTISNHDVFGIENTQGGLFRVKNSIVADACDGEVESQGHNLFFGPRSCVVVGDTNGDIVGQDPLLSFLEDNGGPTQTRGLIKGSPAIDAASPNFPGVGTTSCLATDQRGQPRPLGGRCDMGAVEFE